MNNTQWNEEAVLIDLLCNQKYITGVYNTYYCEGATTEFKNCLSSILADEHRIQEDIFNHMVTAGYYKTEKAEDAKLNTEKQKFAQGVTV